MGRISPAKKRTAAARAAKNDEPHTPDESESESSLAAAPRTPARCKKQLRETEAKLENLRARAHAKQQAVSRTRTQLKGLKTELQETRSNGLDHLASANTASADLDGLGLRHQLVLDSLEDEKAAHSATRVRLELAWAALEAKERAYATLEHTLASERERLDEVKARRNVLKQEVDKYRARERRKAAKAQKPLEQPTFRLKKRNKKKSPLQDDVRDAIAELTGLGVASTPMYRVFLVVARLLGVRLVGEFSSSTVLRCVEEAGFAGRVQLGDAATHATSATISSDSTSVKGINMVAKHLTVLSADQPGIPRTLALPITSIDDHTSAAQKEDWSASLRDIFAAYATCFERGFTATTWREFIGKIKAASTDHANDQKLLIQLLVAWKQEVDRAIRAESALREMGALELLQRVYSELRKERGENPLTSSDWNALSEEEQARAVGEAWRSVVLPIGEAAFQELSVQEQAEVDSLIWAGCCMHKGMNAAKEGFTGMTDKWVSIAGAAPPVKMVNKDNRAALDNASASERQRIYTLSKGGAAKLTELMGALLNHKDDKKGQQDQYKIAFERVFGGRHSFPDTSNVRFGSHLAAAAEVVLHLEFYQDFMKLVHDSKVKPGFTNMEANVALALKCTSTLTELCAAALYYLLVDRPYSARVRAVDSSNEPQNLLDLGPLHEDVIAFCKRIADAPELALDCTSGDGHTGLPRAFDGRAVDRPEVFYAVLARAPNLPHLADMISAFFERAHAKWIVFAADLVQNEQITRMSPEQRRAAFLHPTNDLNEGALGLLRVTMRRAPNLSLRGYNARMLIKRNNVVEFMRSLTPNQRAIVRKQARALSGGGHERKRRVRLAELRVKRAADNVRKRRETEEKAAEKRKRDNERMAGVHVELIFTRIGAMTGPKLDLQIEWHRRRGILDPETGKNVVAATSKLKVAEKKFLLYCLVAGYRFEHGLNPDTDADGDVNMRDVSTRAQTLAADDVQVDERFRVPFAPAWVDDDDDDDD